MQLHYLVGTYALASLLPIAASAVESEGARFDGATVLTLRLDGQVEVDPQGKVLSHALTTDLPEEIRTVTSRAILGWPFEPPMRDGKPARVVSDMKLTLLAQRVGKDYAIKLDAVTFTSAAGPPGDRGWWEITDMKPQIKHPGKPVVALVPVALRLAPTGEVTDAFVTQCIIQATEPGMDNPEMCRTLERNVVRAVRQWNAAYMPAEGETDRPEAPETVILPLRFHWMDAKVEEVRGAWQAEWRTPFRSAPWEKTEPSIASMESTEDGFMQSAPALRLRDGVTGQAL